MKNKTKKAKKQPTRPRKQRAGYHSMLEILKKELPSTRPDYAAPIGSKEAQRLGGTRKNAHGKWLENKFESFIVSHGFTHDVGATKPMSFDREVKLGPSAIILHPHNCDFVVRFTEDLAFAVECKFALQCSSCDDKIIKTCLDLEHCKHPGILLMGGPGWRTTTLLEAIRRCQRPKYGKMIAALRWEALAGWKDIFLKADMESLHRASRKPYKALYKQAYAENSRTHGKKYATIYPTPKYK